MVGTAYSIFKRCFGEFVSVKKWNYMLREIAAKVWIYNSPKAVFCWDYRLKVEGRFSLKLFDKACQINSIFRSLYKYRNTKTQSRHKVFRINFLELVENLI